MGIRNTDYRPPFPYFGGKSAVADRVWDALGDVPNYVEPFFGSGAVLFLRPTPAGVETVNDADGMVANFWRALRADPDAVAGYADHPVNECDLHARHLWLVGERERMTDRLCGDPDFYDAKAAGWWAWGLSCWIGSGWCSGKGPWVAEGGRIVLDTAGQGVNRQLPHLGNVGRGVQRRRPHLSNVGQGVHRKLPHLGNVGRGAEPPDAIEARAAWLRAYLRQFAARLRNVRVCCGDWSRVCGPNVTRLNGLTGVFLDPPYSAAAGRDRRLYATDCLRVAHDVRAWAVEQGRRPDMRVVVAGYEGEHDFPADWSVVAWEAQGGFGCQGDGAGRANRSRERLWLSPHCLRRQDAPDLFAGVE